MLFTHNSRIRLLRLRQWRLADAYDCFDEAYNTARILADLAEILLAAEEPAVLPLTDEAIRILSEESADQHVEYLRRLRERCSGPQE
ncbi:hypothetical protein ACH4EC_08260 [Streptomyces anulatus]